MDEKYIPDTSACSTGNERTEKDKNGLIRLQKRIVQMQVLIVDDDMERWMSLKIQ